MRRLVRLCTHGSIAVLMGLACFSAAAVADETGAGSPTLSLSVTEPVSTGESVHFTGSSSYTIPEQLYLTVFVLPPGASGCPAQAAMPAGADPVLIGEPVDNFLMISALSDELDQPGTWTLCSYLSNSQQTTMASSEVPFAVSGPAIEESEETAAPGAGPSAGVDTDTHHVHVLRHVRHRKGKRHHH